MVAATDYVKLFADQIRAYVGRNFHVLGTDGFGRSDTRASLRRHFEVNRYYVTVAALKTFWVMKERSQPKRSNPRFANTSSIQKNPTPSKFKARNMNQIKQVQVPDMGDFQDVEIMRSTSKLVTGSKVKIH
ncbi:MAG: hypothetical protein Ct9H90mP8_1360 [Pseudomonadota bacterium]|nr:MAG: hypothetical protein Ct9H90mP8_1360 [Pseudomonadota bacterium]